MGNAEKTNITNGIIKAVQRIYENNKTQIKVGRNISKRFTVTKGLK